MKLDYSIIGQSIQVHRKKAGLKQRELADQVHVTAQHISHIETGQTQVSLPVLISISDALKVDLNTLVGYTVTNAQSSAYRGELEFLLTQMGEKKAQFCLELCRMLAAADL